MSVDARVRSEFAKLEKDVEDVIRHDQSPASDVYEVLADARAEAREREVLSRKFVLKPKKR